MLALLFRYGAKVDAPLESYMASMLMLFKMVYPFVLFIVISRLAKTSPMHMPRLYLTLDWMLLVYLGFILIGLLTGSDMFKTYWGGFRPGFKGIVMTQNEATGTMLLAVFWFGLRWFSGQRHVLFFVASILAALIVGTKGALLALPLLLAGMFWARFGILKMIPVFGWVVMGTLMLAVLAYRYSASIHAGVELFTTYMSAHSGGDSVLAMITLLMSGRDMRLESFLPTLANDFSLGFLVGGMPLSYGSMEIDPTDAFLRGGLLFLVLLLVAYWRMFRFSGGHGGKRYKLALFVVWMGIAFTGGHLWMAGTTAPMLVITLVYAGRMNTLGRYVLCAGSKTGRFTFNE